MSFESIAEGIIEFLKKGGLQINLNLPDRIERIGETRKGILAETRDHDKHQLMYFPKSPDHARIFARSSMTRMRGGPGYYYPGAVGALYYIAHREGEKSLPHAVTVQWIQGGFKQGEPKELTRSIAASHGGWREHLLRELFKRIREHPMEFVDFETKRATPESMRAFKRIAREFGYMVPRTPIFIHRVTRRFVHEPKIRAELPT